jgi:DNA polymerase elongation subunit (family B)
MSIPLTRPAEAVTADPPLYGLDIETDTSVDGLDPQVGRVLAVAVAHADGVTVLDDAHEADLLAGLERHLAGLAPGVLVTWNGARFDLPYLSTRASRGEVCLGLRLQADPTRVHRPRPPGRGDAETGAAEGEPGYRACWGRHRHLDVYRCYRADVGPALHMRCSLKAVAALVGLAPIQVDTTRVHALDPDRLRAYVASDAACTRELARRRWANASAAVDRVVA